MSTFCKLQSLKNNANRNINNATQLKDLEPFLEHIPLTQIGDFIKQHFSEHDVVSQLSIYSQCIPLTHILPKDAIQHIISFVIRDEISIVCKSFYDAVQKNDKQLITKYKTSDWCKDGSLFWEKTNEHRYLSQLRSRKAEAVSKHKTAIKRLESQKSHLSQKMSKLCQQIHLLTIKKPPINSYNPKDTQLPPFPTKFIQDFNSILIVDQARLNLTDLEKHHQCQGPFDHPFDAVEKSKSGDIILIYPGIYDDSIDESAFDFTKRKHLQLIGINSFEDYINDENGALQNRKTQTKTSTKASKSKVKTGTCMR